MLVVLIVAMESALIEPRSAMELATATITLMKRKLEKLDQSGCLMIARNNIFLKRNYSNFYNKLLKKFLPQPINF